jgi:RNA polymerase sigma factor (sigma-70 family)
MMETGEAYRELRPLLFSIAYRMVGSVSEAEDIVQESFLRFHRAVREGTRVESPKAYLSAVTTRLAVNHLRSARVRRERYVGTWLPEPLLTDATDDAAQHAETADSVSMAFLVLLESLSPVERAVFLLRDVFGYRYDEIAEAVAKPIHGRQRVARFLLGLGRQARQLGMEIRAAAINGQPGALALDPDGRLVGALCLDIADGQVQTVRSIVNPDKLRHLGPVADG